MEISLSSYLVDHLYQSYIIYTYWWCLGCQYWAQSIQEHDSCCGTIDEWLHQSDSSSKHSAATTQGHVILQHLYSQPASLSLQPHDCWVCALCYSLSSQCILPACLSMSVLLVLAVDRSEWYMHKLLGPAMPASLWFVYLCRVNWPDFVQGVPITKCCCQLALFSRICPIEQPDHNSSPSWKQQTA